MGVDLLTAKFLMYCTTLNVNFEATATLGRQSLYVERRDAAALFEEFGLGVGDAQLDAIFGHGTTDAAGVGFSEPFFEALGAVSVDAIDASDYEGASIIHNMNEPVPDELEGRFSVLIDGGTLEHVFHFPIAIENCMRMVRKGGHFISISPANNYCGHGFYQFSSELFFRVFSEPNGFRVRHMFLSAEKSFGAWYAVPDPASIRRRVTLNNQVPTLQLLLAEKIADDAGLHVCPQQSDYSSILWQGAAGEDWTSHGEASVLKRAAIYRRALGYFPRSAAQFLRASRQLLTGALKPPFRNPVLVEFRATAARRGGARSLIAAGHDRPGADGEADVMD